jgi:transcriptional regulator of arginine metabolism
MRYSRQNKVLELIEEHEVCTQEQLCQLLKEAGYDVTQATVSRDIKELQLVKTMSPSGKYRYAQSDGEGPISDRFVNIFRHTIKSATPAENLIVVKTLSGCASAAGEAIDSLNLPHVAGSVAGDNTLLIVARSSKDVPALMKQFNKLLK